jgi:hypothetical protein
MRDLVSSCSLLQYKYTRAGAAHGPTAAASAADGEGEAEGERDEESLLERAEWPDRKLKGDEEDGEDAEVADGMCASTVTAPLSSSTAPPTVCRSVQQNSTL